jgi:hypothetical protein
VVFYVYTTAKHLLAEAANPLPLEPTHRFIAARADLLMRAGGAGDTASVRQAGTVGPWPRRRPHHGIASRSRRAAPFD